MYADMNDAELQAWLLSQSINDDAILAPEDEWQAASGFHDQIRDQVYASQYRRNTAEHDQLRQFVENDDGL